MALQAGSKTQGPRIDSQDGLPQGGCQFGSVDDGAVAADGNKQIAGKEGILHTPLIHPLGGKQIGFQHRFTTTSGEDAQRLIRTGLGRFLC